MKTVAYLAGVVCTAPLVVFALGVLALGHVIETRNFFAILYHAILAFAWGIPLAFVGCVGLLACGFFPMPRLVASGLLVALNFAAAAVVLRAVGFPRTFGEGAYLGPTLVALWLHGRLLWSGTRPRPASPVPPDATSAPPGP